tara:strand:+ start:229 stop:852 length:624 start_codon:yes stop_codon:yes gene_type:complete
VGVKKYYDAFAQNFMAGSEKPEDDSPSVSGDGLEAIDSAEISEAGPDISFSGDSQESSPKVEGLEERTAPTPIELHDQETGPTDAGSTPSVSSSAQDDGPEVAGGGDAELRERVIAALREVYDPEIPLNIYDLGLIYRLEIDSDHKALIDMTLTSPNCPVAGSLPGEIENAARSAEGVGDVVVELVWDPPWDMDRMGEAAKLELGMF